MHISKKCCNFAALFEIEPFTTQEKMKIRSFIAFVVLGGLLLSATPVSGQEVKSSKRFGGNGPAMRVSNKHNPTQLYHGIVATFSGIIFSGDIAKAWPLLRYGAFGDNMGLSGTLNYKLTFNPYVSMRFGVQAGLLRGSNEKIVEGTTTVTSRHNFKSTMVQEFVGVECYPILNYGFFLYTGFGVAENFISHYYHERRDFKADVTGAFSLVPMFHIGLGYNFFLDQNWTLGIELMGQIAMMESEKNGFDGWPYEDGSGFNMSKTYPDYKSEVEKYNKAKAPDGWFQFGIVLSYHFN